MSIKRIKAHLRTLETLANGRRLLLALAFVVPAVALAADLEKTSIFGEEAVNTSVLDLGSGQGGRTVHLPQGRARLVRLPVRIRDIIIADPEVVDVVVKSPQLLYLLGKKAGGTNIVLLDRNGEQIMDLEVQIFREVGGLRQTLETMLPDEKIQVSAVGETVILSGTVSSARAAEDARVLASRYLGDEEIVLNRLRIAQEQQVALRVRVAEVSRSVMKVLNTSGSFGTHRAAPSDSTLFDFYDRIGLTSAPTIGHAGAGYGRVPGADTIGAVYTNASLFGGMAALLEALETEGLIRTLAEPTLTSISGKQATFLAGGEFPVPSGVDNSGRVQIEYKEFGVSIAFTPVVLDGGRINMTVATEVSQIDETNAILLGGFRIPALQTRRAVTTVEMPSGAALVIAGLLQNDISNVVDGFPGLRNIPILGALFRSVSFERQETELVITVTPYLIEPMNDRDLMLPTDGFAPASDLDMYFLGRLHARYGAQGQSLPEGQPRGPIGYMVE